MRVWSEDEGRYIECESIWDGRNPMPHELENREVWRYTGNLLLEAAPERGSFPNQADKAAIARNTAPADMGMDPWRQKRKAVTKCRCGRPKMAKRAQCKRCNAAARARVADQPTCRCGTYLPRAEVRLGVRRCKPCRTAHPAKGQEAAA
jgi:hypothetical protein